ncbi:IclR family transcriptional regulator [Streptomyces sp. NPDC013161]|uniref:IclR family transcriptional regulator n=1 Tax=Streptomyces sp. NPDC013161 TaxID=3364862 RepID=UPI003682CB52
MYDGKAPGASETGARLVDRFIRVLNAVTQLDGKVHGTGEIAKEAGLDDSTTSRILRSGVKGRFLQRVSHGKFQLGVASARLGLHALAHMSAKDESTHTVLEDLRAATGEGLIFQYMLAPVGGAYRQCIDMAVGDSDLAELGMTARSILSVTRSLRVGASGRTILAHLPERILELVLNEPIPPESGPGVYRKDDELRESLVEIRARGYALGYEECMALWNSCAAPILWNQTIMGAVLLLKPATAMPEPSSAVIEATKAAAAEISAKLGRP